ncbi:uncharacterized protein TNCT_484771 [Trichonephila clavata]|uniref:Reverse transcriptase domain-containing protein n=1 Tax=Trichonephila clavata TaxID=2740835 RepID=A0A8X6I1V8_TRICU|nr:uncharacterized protein TNCT_484771 [Trichonephila clavata]
MLTVHIFQSERPTKHVYPKVRIRVKSLISNKEIEIEALETKQLSSAHISIPAKEVRERIERLDESLVAVETIFGFCIHGSISEDKDNDETSVNLAVSKESISDQLNQFWQLENLGIEVEEDIKDISENEIFKSFESSIEYSDDYAKENIIESVIETPKLQGYQPTFYLPHTCVKRLDKTTTKIRIVFDGSSHGENQLSLNDCLNSGVNLNPDLLELILKFRENPIAYTADIEKAFLQIELHEQDRDVARLFWTKNLIDYDPKNLQVYRLTQVLFGLTSSPFMLAATIRYHLKKYKDKFPDTAKIVESSLNVDDFIRGQENVDKALQTSLESIEIFKEAGMSLRKWLTNSKELERFWIENKVPVEEFNCLSDEEVVPLKVLGICWDKKEDKFYFDFTVGLRAGQIDLIPLLRIELRKSKNYLPPSDWHHCPGKENPAEFLTRVEGAEEKNLELRRKSEKTIQNQCILEPNDHVLDLKKYSSLNKVLRVTAWILRFLTNRRRNNIKDSYLSLSLHANEIEQAELYWIKETEREFYSSEILALKKQQPIRHDSKIRSLVPILDSQDILRISTRLEEADLVIGEKQPILLPTKSKFTELLVIREHITVFHSGVSATLTQIRRKF